MKPRVYIICPVRNVKPKQKQEIDNYVNNLESCGYQVYYPPRDTHQNDPIGTMICMANRRAIEQADEVHIYYDPSSSGSIFDLGMAYAMHKTVRLINEVKSTDGKKGFSNLVKALDCTLLDSLDV